MKFRTLLVTLVASLSVLSASSKTDNNWAVILNKTDGTLIPRGDTLCLWSKGDLMVVDTMAQPLRDLRVEFTLLPANELSGIGAMLRYRSPSEWIYVGCDLTTDILGYCQWYVETPAGRRQIATDIAKLYKGFERHVRIDMIGESVMIRVDGEKIANFVMPWPGSEAGNVGFRAHKGGEAQIYDVRITPLQTAEPIVIVSASASIASADLSVDMLDVLPVSYNYRGRRVQANKIVDPAIEINGTRYTPVLKGSKTNDSTALHTMSIAALGIEIDIQSAVRGHIFEQHVTAIREKGDTKIQTIGMAGNRLVSMPNDTPGAALSIAYNEGSDGFWRLADRKMDTIARSAAIVILNDAHLAVTLDNNSAYESRQFLFQTTPEGTSIGTNEWIYRGLDGMTTELPYQKVIFAGDVNGDGRATWQDGAVALAEVYPDPYGVEMMRNANATITMNFASEGQFPFLRQLDNIKKIYYLTDGFGQMLELKGYQSEGHDSAHPDYAGNYNTRAGGLADLTTLIGEAKKYNAHIGVHINHSEAYPEARAFNDSIMTRIPGWRWLDQAYLLNKEADHRAGTFRQRLDNLKADLPELSFIYLDTYRDHRYMAYRTARLFNERGWSVWTEDPSVFNRYATWIHYNPGSRSRVSRFVHNHRKDGFATDSLLLGGYGRGADVGFQGWQSGRDMNVALRNFYTKQLPLRYIMHFPVIYIDGDKARFRDSVETRCNNGVTSIWKDGKMVATGNVVFLPWSPAAPEKIFHYNPKGGTTTWDLPAEWGSLKSVRLFRLTDRGRESLGALPVTAGRVTIDARADVPYVLYRAEPEPLLDADWSHGSPVRDMGFDSRSLRWWSATGNRKGVTFEVAPHGQSYLRLDGAKACGVQQSIDSLTVGQAYTLTAWVEVDGRRPARLALTQGDQTLETEIDQTTIKTYVENTDKRGSRYERLRIAFRATQPRAVVSLGTAAVAVGDTSRVSFDDVRLMKINDLTERDGYIYWEDFENVDFGWGPFMLTRPSDCTSHISESHGDHTEGDVIRGNRSFKSLSEGTGEILRTMPSLLNFAPERSYRLTFEYNAPREGVYRAVVRSLSTGRVLLSTPLDGRGLFDRTFSTDLSDDYYFSIVKAGDGMLIIDDFGVMQK